MNGIERDLGGRARVVRLNLFSRLGSQVARSHGVQVVPTTIVFDGAGRIRSRYEGLPSRKRIVEELTAGG